MNAVAPCIPERAAVCVRDRVVHIPTDPDRSHLWLVAEDNENGDIDTIDLGSIDAQRDADTPDRVRRGTPDGRTALAAIFMRRAQVVIFHCHIWPMTD